MYTLLLLNGGVGARIGADRPKQFLDIKGIPILVYSLVAADRVPEISKIIINYPSDWHDEVAQVVSDYAISTPVELVEAGSSRHDSVAKMLAYSETDHVIIHESARPMVTRAEIEELIAAPGDNVAFMLPIPFTVAPVDPKSQEVTGSLERDGLRNVQLPQKFARKDLQAGHDYAQENDLVFTEDATLVAVAGPEVRFIDGYDTNIKVTTPTDIRLATFLLSEAGDLRG